jgi:hypothetical protein
MADIKVKYPSTSTTALTISLGSLANDSTNFLAGQESTAVDNTTNLDLDHLLSGVVRAGTTPTSGNRIEVWVYAPIRIASGTPTYPDVFDGTDSAETATSRNVLFSALRLAHTIVVDATSDRDYFIPMTSIASLFGGQMPQFWGVFVVNGSGAALNATGGNHILHYNRIQAQSV